MYPPCQPSPRYAEDDDYLAHANLLSPSAPFSLHRNEPRPAKKTQPPPTTAGDAHPNHPGDVGSAPRTAGGPTPIRLPASVSATLLSFKSPATTTAIGRTGAPSDSTSPLHPPPLSHDGFYPYVRNVQSPLGTLARIGMVLLHPGGTQGTGGTRSPEQGPRELRSHCPLLRFTGNPPPPRHDLGCKLCRRSTDSFSGHQEPLSLDGRACPEGLCGHRTPLYRLWMPCHGKPTDWSDVRASGVNTDDSPNPSPSRVQQPGSVCTMQV